MSAAGSTLELKSATHWDGGDETLGAEFDVRIPGATTKTGHRMLVPLEIYATKSKPFLTGASRVHAVNFDYPDQVSDDATVQLPAGYGVEPCPSPRPLARPEAPATYQLRPRVARFT